MKGCETWHNTCCLAEYKDACSLCIRLSVCVPGLTDDVCSICPSWVLGRKDRREIFDMKDKRGEKAFTFSICWSHCLLVSSNSFTVLSSFHSLFLLVLFSLPFFPERPIKPVSLHLFAYSLIFLCVWACTLFSFPLLYYAPSCHKQWILNKFPLRTLTPETRHYSRSPAEPSIIECVPTLTWRGAKLPASGKPRSRQSCRNTGLQIHAASRSYCVLLSRCRGMGNIVT